MIDIMVSMAVIGLLIAISLPALSTVRESARKVVCGSNLRQVGLGMSVYSQDFKDALPDSVFLPQQYSNSLSSPSLNRMDTVRLSGKEYSDFTRDELWDGIGILFNEGYVTAPGVFYCPSHHGEFVFDNAADDWNNTSEDEIIANYFYRGAGPDGQRKIVDIYGQVALVTDTIRSYNDLNHVGGVNILQAGLAVEWVDDVGDQIAEGLLLRENGGGGAGGGTTQSLSQAVRETWGLLDQFTSSTGKQND
mgnify:FL=1